MKRPWYEIAPKDAINITLPNPEIEGPLIDPEIEEGKECPWPWDPQQLVGAPLGQYHCPYCGSMVIAGMRHPDWRTDSWEVWS